MLHPFPLLSSPSPTFPLLSYSLYLLSLHLLSPLSPPSDHCQLHHFLHEFVEQHFLDNVRLECAEKLNNCTKRKPLASLCHFPNNHPSHLSHLHPSHIHPSPPTHISAAEVAKTVASDQRTLKMTGSKQTVFNVRMCTVTHHTHTPTHPHTPHIPHTHTHHTYHTYTHTHTSFYLTLNCSTCYQPCSNPLPHPSPSLLHPLTECSGGMAAGGGPVSVDARSPPLLHSLPLHSLSAAPCV